MFFLLNRAFSPLLYKILIFIIDVPRFFTFYEFHVYIVCAERPAHTISPVYISEVPWPPPSVTTSYIPLCPPTPPPTALILLFLLLLLLLLPFSAQAFLICIPLRWHSSPPLDSPSVVSFASSSPNDAIRPTTPLSVLRGFTHTHVLRPCITRTTRGSRRLGGGRDKERDYP